MRILQLPGRSPVPASEGMAATSHAGQPDGHRCVEGGGNALDAAVAACAVQGVVEPESTGFGGDCFCLYSKGGSTDVVAYNAGVIPACPDQHPCAHSRMPMEMIFQGRSISLFQASQQGATMFS